MKKILYVIFLILIFGLTFYLSYGFRNHQNPKVYYKVYLNDEVLGVIDSETKLTKFIDKESENIKNKYKVNNVYAPEGLVIESISSYDQKVSSVEEIFAKIKEKATLTIEGYQINIKSSNKPISLYVTDEKIFKKAVTDLIKTFVGEDKYNSYVQNTQTEIKSTGSIVENIYIQDDITIKKSKIPVSETIYIDEENLSQFLLFGENVQSTKYIVKLGDTISKVAYENQISTEEFLISNPQFTDKTNLLHVGQEVTIAVTNPQLKVVLEEYEVADMESAYIVEERIDPDKYIGQEEVLQNGENGIIRVTQNVQTINGVISYINPIDRTELKPVINKIIVKGEKTIPNVGDLKNWAWPTLSGYTITDDFEWRTNPITGKREHHSGIDISGTGYGSPIYAANNGTIITKKYSSDYGYYIVINHNNGYWTLYAHMSRFASNLSIGQTISRGQIIGYVGSTGWSTGPHLHFEVWKNCDHCRINPFTLYR